jgi:hypothetical protein
VHMLVPESQIYQTALMLFSSMDIARYVTAQHIAVLFITCIA